MRGCEVQGARAEAPGAEGEQGFMLLGLMVAIAIILLMLGVAASEMAFSLRRDKELESARRADQYVRAIAWFSRKNNGQYPGSIKQLENTNNVRYLRKEYVDPLTGKADYRLIVVGQNKTTVKGFFGKPLGGLDSSGAGGPGGSQVGSLSSVGVNGASGATGATGSTGSTGATGGTGASGAGAGTDGASSGLTPVGSPQGGAGLTPGAGPIMGVGSNASGPSILTVNGQNSYETWEFLWDPRLDQLVQAAALNAGVGSTGAGGSGSSSSSPNPPLDPVSK